MIKYLLKLKMINMCLIIFNLMYIIKMWISVYNVLIIFENNINLVFGY